MTGTACGQLLAVSVGLPRDILWRGQMVRTAIWKEPVEGRRRVSRLNIDGDGQADLRGHGGEQRAVFVYQTDSYRYWETRLERRDLSPGQFGENFTIDGLPDDEVCIGDRYRIGSAFFEVTQPRVTCYRLGIRLDHPQMPSLLTSSGRPGFYLRVLEEGDVGAGDIIELVSRGPEQMTVKTVNALLYSSHHPEDELRRALNIPALSPGWRGSFETLLEAENANPGAAGNPALTPSAASHVSAPGFRPMRIAQVIPEAADILSFRLEAADGAAVTRALPGQFVALRLHPKPDGPALVRSYSVSGQSSRTGYRISVKIEPGGLAGAYLSSGVHVGDVIEVSQPRGAFTLGPGEEPVVLLSAGIGATPVLAMLQALAADASEREVWWLHATRSGETHAFGGEARDLLANLRRGRSQVWFTRPTATDHAGFDYDAAGRPAVEAFAALGVPPHADFYLCGPQAFIDEMSQGLAAWGAGPQKIHWELFGGGGSLKPGLMGGPRPPPSRADLDGEGPLVSFARSGVSMRWRAEDQSLLDLAEACGVPVRWSCRAGVCHNCETGLISGAVTNDPDPLDPPVTGNVLICCARPKQDVVLDL